MHAMTPTVRPATPDDAELIHRFVCELAEYEREPAAVKTTSEGLRAQMLLARPPFECAIAELDGEPAGFALFFHNYSTWTGKPGIYLEDLFVRPTARGRGLGKALLVHLARLACERGCGRFEWAVLDWNRPAIEFYEALRAVPMSEWTVYRLAGDALQRLADADGLRENS
jgi:GNAT superfamily N-acetyltransferase